jgi:predicted ATP-binding protein involved in virulence
MKANSLTLTNYRGFQKLEIQFDKKITVLAGVNGSGKSAVLRALAATLAHLQPQISPSKESPASLTDGDVHKDKSALTISATFQDDDQLYHAQLTRAIPDRAKAMEYAKRRNDARFAIRETVKGSKEEKMLQDEIRFLNELIHQEKDHFALQTQTVKIPPNKRQKSSLPITVLYSTSRYLDQMPPRLPTARPFEPANAYQNALAGVEVSLGAFATWFRAARSGELGGKKARERLLHHLEKVIANILPGFSEPRLKEEAPPKFFVNKKGKEFELYQLSDGERGLLALVFDLTRRLAIANPHLEDPVAESRAIVLLDEIELHLHPSWQREVMGRLTRTFENCQFIATTHSPQVIGEVERHKMFLISPDYPDGYKRPPVAKGADSNWILDHVMEGAASETLSAKTLQAEAEDALAEGNLKQARKKLEAFRKLLDGDTGDLVRLESSLYSLESLAARARSKKAKRK